MEWAMFGVSRKASRIDPFICGCVQCFKRSATMISGSLINKTRKYMWYKMRFLFQVSKTKGVGMEHTTTHSDLISLAEFQTKWGKSSHNKGVHIVQEPA